MPRIPIAIDDPRLDDYRDLKNRPAEKPERFIVEGRWLLERLVASPHETISALCSEQFADEVETMVPAETPIFVATTTELNSLVGFDFHRGILGTGRRPSRASLDDVLHGIDASPTTTIVVCPNVANPTNLGSIIRNCAAFGVDGLILGGGCADPYSRRSIRVSMAAALSLPIVEVGEPMATTLALRDEFGFEIVSAALAPDSQELPTVVRKPRTVLVFGNEGDGLDDVWIKQSDLSVAVPMRDGIDSLNVGTASGIFLFYFTQIAGCA